MRFRSRGVTADDVLLVSYPRTGSTWLRFMLHNVLTGRDAEFGKVLEVLPYVGRHHTAPAVLPEGGRVLKSHERRAAGGARAVYMVRNPFDVALSEYRYNQRRGFFEGDLDTFIDRFVRGRVNPYGSWGAHVHYWTNYPRLIATIKYEDLRKEPGDALKGLLDALGVDVDRAGVDAAVEQNTLQAMQAKEARSPFKDRPERPDIKHVGSGSVQGWKEQLSAKQVARIRDAFGDAMERVGYP